MALWHGVDCSSTWPRIPRHSCRTIHQGDELDGHLGTKTCLCCTRPRMINRSVPDKTHARQPTSPHTSLCSAVLARVCAVPATSATKSGPTHLRGPAARADCALCGRRPAERYPPKSERFVSRCTGDKYRNLHVSFQGVKETGNTP